MSFRPIFENLILPYRRAEFRYNFLITRHTFRRNLLSKIRPIIGVWQNGDLHILFEFASPASVFVSSCPCIVYFETRLGSLSATGQSFLLIALSSMHPDED